MRYLLTAAFVMALINSAMAGEATCRDYTRVKDEDRSLFDGYIWGFIMAKIGDRGDAEVNTATARVKELADKYCPGHPDDRLTVAIASFTKVVSQYGSGTNAVLSPWDTHQKCEELALRIAYPRKLNECADNKDACKKVAGDWMNEAVRLKKDCLNKK